MRLTIIDGRTLGITVIQPGNGLVWNWSTSAWDAISAAGAQHIQPLAPMPGAAAPYSSILSAELGASLNGPGASPVVWQLGTGGLPTAAVDWSTLVVPGPNPQTWNWPR